MLPDQIDLPDLKDLDDWIAARENAVGGIREGCAKRVVWADAPAKTKTAIVYVHGFSASPEETRPLPDLVAQALGANLFFTRLAGHGQDGTAMGRAQLPDWEADVDEALAIGAALGEDVIVMGCSTGCTLLTAALAGGAVAKGIVHLSPNFGLRNLLAHGMLQMPGVRTWGPWVVGRERSVEPISEAHEAYWTLKYDMQAVCTMNDAVCAAMASPVEAIQTPAYFAFGEADQVVSPRKTRQVMARWAGPVREDILVQGQRDDATGHVMVGDVFSPDQTQPLAERIITWAKSL